jgi:phosphoribosyl-dephospho-CoA transferase
VIRRHSLVWLRNPPATPESHEATAWHQDGRPFIVCRTRPGEQLSLGFCLPQPPGQSGSPIRIAAHSDVANIERFARPLDLHDEAARRAIPVRMLNQLLAPPDGCSVRLIGSRMWEAITGDRYTSDTSDLDLVIDLSTPAAADPACDFLQSIESPCRLDAEVSFPDVGEVHWKEWQSDADPVLVKSLHAVALVSRADLLSAENEKA